MTEERTQASINAPTAPVGEGELLGGKYRIGRQLGIGGMGVVVSARDELLDREVAIKFLLPRLSWSENSVQRFLREARAATRITSEHVVKLLEIDKLPSGVPFFVMEHLAGADLKTWLNARGPLPIEDAVDHLMQSLQAIAEGHTKSIVHRDLKPSNLFLTQRADGTALVKVLDFGIAKTLHHEQGVQSVAITDTGDGLLGSPSYMSPEQLLSPRDVDPRSDIWSLGVTLFELLSGKLPFDGDTKFAIISNIIHTAAVELDGHSGSRKLPSALVKVIARCLQKNREYRFATARELAHALAPFGSEDARISLRRILGLGSGPIGLEPTPSRGIESVRAISTTLPIPRTQTPVGVAADTRSSEVGATRGWWLIVGSVVLAAGFSTWWVVRAALSRSVQPVAQSPLLASPAPVLTTSQLAASASTTGPAAPTPTTAVPSAAPPVPQRARSAPNVRAHQPTTVALTASARPLPSVSATTAPSAREEFEELIQRRR